MLNLDGADVQAGKLVFDYTGGTSPATTVETLLAASCDNGRWDSGKFRDSTALATGLTLGCFDDPLAHTVTVMPTYAGDFNLDGVVNDLDLAVWQANFGMGTTWQMGDANYDGVVNGLDLDLLHANFGKTPLGGAGLAGTPPVTPVPEPGTLTLLAAGLIGLLSRFSRRR